MKDQLDRNEVDAVLAGEGLGPEARAEELTIEQMISLVEGCRFAVLTKHQHHFVNLAEASLARSLPANPSDIALAGFGFHVFGRPTACDLPKYLEYLQTRSHHMVPSIPIRSKIG